MLLFGCTAITLKSQTTLVEGDIAFTYLQDGEKYSFVLLRDVDFGTQVVVMSNGSIITGWTAPVGGASAGDVITVSTSDAKEEGVVAFYGGASCAFTGLAQISPKGFDHTDDECSLSTGQDIEWNNQKTVWYTGPRTGLTASEYLDEFNDLSNWESDDDNDEDEDNTTSFSIESSSGGGGSGGGENLNSLPPTTLAAGDIAFTAFNSDSGDDIAFVLLKDVNATTVIRISDNDWDGSSISENNYLEWTSGEALSAGTVVVINDASNTNSGGQTINVGSVTETGTFQIAGDNEEIWAYTGTGSDITFLAAIANDNGRLNLSGSGLTTDESVFSSDDDDGIYYSGSRVCVTAADINDFSNWTSEEESGNNILPIDATSFSVGPVGSDVLFSENFDDDEAFTFGNSSYFFSDGENDYIGIYDPSGSTDDFGGGAQPSGIPSYTGNTGNYLVARDVDAGGVNPTELIWTVNTSSYESCAQVSIDLGNQGMDDGDDLRVYFSTDGTNYTEAFNFTGSTYWGPNDLSIETYTAEVSIPIAETVYVKLSLSGATQNGDRVAIDEFKIFGTVNCTPVTVSASPVTVDLDSSGEVVVNGATVSASSTGDCFTVSSYEVSKTEGGTYASSVTYDCTETGAQTLYVRATDGSNVSDATSVTVTVQDVTAPSVPSVSVSDIEIGADGTATITASAYASGSTDNCSSQGLTYLVSTDGASGFATTLDVDCTDLGALTLYFLAQDASGNQSTSTLMGDGAFTVVDNLGPTITAVTPTTVNLSAGVATLNVSSLTFTASDNCTDSGSLTYTVSASSGGSFGSSVDLDCTDIPTTTLYFKATDASGNASAEFSQAFTVGETNAPTISSTSGATVNLDGAGSVTVTASSTYVTATDDCSSGGDLTYLVSDAADGTYAGTIDLGCSDVGAKTLYFKVQDAAGNLSSASSASFTVDDVNDPSVTASDISVGLAGSSVTVNATDVVSSSSDNCSVSSTQIKLTSAGDGAYASSLDFSAFGDYGVTVRVSDAAGNTATATATVTVTSELYSEDFEDESTNSDLCSPSAYTPSDNNWTPLCPGGTSSISTLSAGDEAFKLQGNTGSSLEDSWQSATFSVAGLSNVLLTFDARSDGGIENSGGNLDQFDVYAVKDGSEILLFGVDGHLDGTGGTKTVDDSFSQAIALSSVSELSILIKARVSASDESYFFDDFRVCADDNDNGVCDELDCETVVVTASPSTEDLDASGEVVVTASSVSAGYTGDCFTPTSYEVSKSSGSGFGASVTYDCTETGAQTLYVRATDGSSTSGNTAVTVTVQDVTVPTISSASGGSIELDANGDGVITASTTYVSGAADNCSGQGLTYLVSDASDGTYAATLALTCSDLSGKDVYFKVEDASGNRSAAAGPASFTVTDNTAPTYTTTGGTFNLSGGSVSVTFADVTTGLTDACDASPTTEVSKNNSTWSSSVTYDCSDAGTSPTLYVRAADASGNVNATSVSISIADNTTPVITAVSPTSVQLSSSAATVSISGLTITASDDCTSSGALTYTVSTASDGTYGSSVDFECADIGTVALFFKAEDAAGNLSAAFEQDFTVTDATGLTAIGQDITVNLDASGNYALSASEVDNGSIGNCNTTLSVSPSSFTCDDLGANVVTLTISDGTPSDSTTVTVTVQDVTPPNFTALPSLAKALDASGAGTIVPTDVGVLANPADACTDNGDITFEIRRQSDASFGATVSVSCSDVGVPFNVVLRASDASGNTSVSANIPVTVSDNTAPTISSVTSGLTEALSSAGVATIAASDYISASDNCTASGSLTYEISETSGSGFATTFAADCDDLGAKTFYFRASDASGNVSAESSESITIADNTSPTATAVDRVLILTGASVSLSASDANFNTSTDNCSFTSLVKLTSAGDETYASSLDFSSTGTFSVTLKVTDAGGNVSTDTATITVTAEPDEVTLYTEDFEDDVLENGQSSYPYFCPLGITEAHDGNWRLSCGDGESTVFPVPSTTDNGFNWYSASGAIASDWYSDTIDVASILAVSATLNVSEDACGGCTTEGLTLYTILDGGTPVQQDTETGNFGSGTLDITDLSTASASTLVLKVTGTATSGADLYLTEVSVTGTCIDLDGNGICDDDQNCVDVPAGTCGCTDKTACTYSATASTNDPDSCQYVGYECQDPSGTTGYTWTLSAGSCSCSSADFNTLYFEDFGSGGEAGGQGSGYGYDGYEQLTNVTGTDVNVAAGVGTDGWFLEFDDANVGDGALDGTEPDYFITYYTLSTAGSISQTYSADVTDTSMWANYTVSGVHWVSKLLNVGDYSDLRLSTDLFGQQGNTSDYVGVRLGDNRMPFAWTSATGATNSFTTFTKDLQVDVDTIRIQVDIDANAASSFHALDDVVLSAWGKSGCTDSEATNYDSTAQVDDGSCTGITFTTAYSRYDGGFSDKIWAGTACGGDCGSAPFPEAKSVAALAQTSSTTFDYVISSGTTVTVDGTTPVAGNASLEDLFVNDLTIESGGSLVIPEGKRIRVMGTFTDQDGTGVTGAGRLCIDGTFAFDSQSSFTAISVPDLQLPPGASVTVPSDKSLNVTGDVFFGATNPTVSGKITLSGSSAQAITGNGAAFDELEIDNANGVSVSESDKLDINGRLTVTSGTFAGASTVLSFKSVASTSEGDATEEEKTAVLDAIPAEGAELNFSSVEVERYFAADGDDITLTGYSLFGSPIQNVTVGDLAGIEGFNLQGWSGTTNENYISSILQWDETQSTLVPPTNNSTALDEYGGIWALIAYSATPTFKTSGTLNSHTQGDSKTFALTRTDNSNTVDAYEGWNLVYNPFQARLDWDEVIGNSDNASLIEDQYVIYDTQTRQTVRYSKLNANGGTVDAAQCIEPGQAFWVRKTSVGSGSLTLTPSMIDNDGPESEFVRSAEEGTTLVIVETENYFGATRSVLRFEEGADAEGYMDGDLSRLASSSVRSGEMAFVAGGQAYVAKALPKDVHGDLFVRSRANFPTTMRVLDVIGESDVCAHIADNETGAILLLQEGEEIEFTLPTHEAPTDRFTIHAEPFAVVTGLAPACPDSEAGMVIVELDEVIADLTVIDYSTMDIEAQLGQVTGMVEIPVSPGEYSVIVQASEETSVCRGGRRHVVVFPGEEPEILNFEAEPAECNVGFASMSFELYGGGEFLMTLWLDAEPVWQESLLPGEHVIDGLEPGEYMVKVEHACYEDVDWINLDDPGLPDVTPVYTMYNAAQEGGGAILEATCLGCLSDNGFGYYWMVDGIVTNVNEDLYYHAGSLGVYDVQLLAFGPGCEVTVPFEMLVGKHKVDTPESVRWLGIMDGTLGAVFDEEWSGARLRWYDAAGRLLLEEQPMNLLGEMFLRAPDAAGWVTLEVTAADGRRIRWSGVN